MVTSKQLLIIGASARAAAWSALRAGFAPTAMDLFCDLDLQDRCPTWKLDSLEFRALKRVATSELPFQFVIVGGMENRGDFLSRMSKSKQHIGSSIESIGRSKNPFEIEQICNTRGLNFPAIRSSDNPGAINSDWVAKPLNSSGGFQVQRCSAHGASLEGSYFFQEWVEGRDMSSVFCRFGEHVQYIGTTEQLVGRAPFCDRRNSFGYCGSVGPIRLNNRLHQQVARMGEVLGNEFKLDGVFGIDWIWANGDVSWIIEINPRWTASCEIFERAGVCQSLIGRHVQACFGQPPKPTLANEAICGKAIVYNRNLKIRVSKPFVSELQTINEGVGQPRYADISNVGQVIEPHHPVLTILVEDSEINAVKAQLVDRAEAILRRIKKLEVLAPSSL